MKKTWWIIIALALVGGAVSSVTFTVNQNEYAVKTQFGKPVQTILEPGLYFQWPAPIQRVNRFDRRLQLHQGLLMETLTRDKKNIALRCAVVWRISDPAAFFVSVGTMEAAAQKLDDLLTSQGAGAAGDFDFDDLITVDKPIQLPDLEQMIEDQLAQRLESGHYGMMIRSVEVDRLALPEANANAVYQRMTKERNAIANKYRAEGEEEAAKIRAQADREKSDLLSTAYEEAQKQKGEGEAQAARIYAEAYNRDPAFYQFWRTLQSYPKILDQKTTLVLSEDSDLLKLLGK